MSFSFLKFNEKQLDFFDFFPKDSTCTAEIIKKTDNQVIDSSLANVFLQNEETALQQKHYLLANSIQNNQLEEKHTVMQSQPSILESGKQASNALPVLPLL